jgi:hypothetical protein
MVTGGEGVGLGTRTKCEAYGQDAGIDDDFDSTATKLTYGVFQDWEIIIEGQGKQQRRWVYRQVPPTQVCKLGVDGKRCNL